MTSLDETLSEFFDKTDWTSLRVYRAAFDPNRFMVSINDDRSGLVIEPTAAGKSVGDGLNAILRSLIPQTDEFDDILG